MVKKLLIIGVACLAVAACHRGPSPEKRRCMAAVASVQEYWSFPAQDLVQALQGSKFSNVPRVFSTGAIPSASRGTLVIETRSRMNASSAQRIKDPVANIYCL